MQAVDTNVLVRALVGDPGTDLLSIDQVKRAKAFVDAGVRGDGIFVSTVVVIEFVWFLRYVLKTRRKEDIFAILDSLFRTTGFHFEDVELLRRALQTFGNTKDADFADYVILETARKAEALPLATFDAALQKSADVFAV